jgi:hypothetical protein
MAVFLLEGVDIFFITNFDKFNSEDPSHGRLIKLKFPWMGHG